MVDPFVALSRFLFDGALGLDAGTRDATPPDWPAGTRLDAVVRAVAEPSRALLQIGNQLVDAKLPVPAQAGERLALRVVEPFPKLVFALESRQGDPSAVRTQVNLSGAARVLGELVSRETTGSQGRPLALAQTLPLPAPAEGGSHAEAVAAHLKQSVERSGLFYERHQARWVAGEFPLNELKQEPQAQRPALTRAPSLPVPEASRELVRLDKEIAPPSDRAAPERGASSAVLDPRPAGEGPLRGQMELLDGRGLTVTLPAWAGRQMSWDLPEREPQGDPHEPAAWSTHLAVDLPVLGTVRAHLRISGNGLALALNTDSPESAHRLAQAQIQLMQSLQDAGLDLTQLNIAVAHE